MNNADLRDALMRDHDHKIRALIEDVSNLMEAVNMTIQAIKDLNERLKKLEGPEGEIRTLEVVQ